LFSNGSAFKSCDSAKTQTACEKNKNKYKNNFSAAFCYPN